MTKDILRDIKEDLNYERSKRMKLEETLKEQEQEIRNLREGLNSPIGNNGNNTIVKILVRDEKPVDKERERKMLEEIKNNLRKMSAKGVSCSKFISFFSDRVEFDDTLTDESFSQASVQYIKEEKENEIKKEYVGEYFEYFKQEKD